MAERDHGIVGQRGQLLDHRRWKPPDPRRKLRLTDREPLQLAALTVVGKPVLGEVVDLDRLALAADAPLPAKVGMGDVVAVRTLLAYFV